MRFCHQILRNVVIRSCGRAYSVGTSEASSTTINQEEIAHFSRLSSQWWDEQGEFMFLHKMNPLRMQFIKDKLLEISRVEEPHTLREGKNVLNGLDVLDVGCGGGLLSESLARMGAKTLGIDASHANIRIASAHALTDPQLRPSSGMAQLCYLNTSAEALLSQPARYDIVCSMEVLEHVDNPAAFLSTCAELLKPGGHLFLSTISRTPVSYVLAILLAEDILRKVSSGTHTYSKFVNPSELIEFFREYRSSQTERHASSFASTPWITMAASSSYPNRLEAELRGLIYNPLQARWYLAPRNAWGALLCNYLFWVTKPKV